jgi:nucleoside triphosphate diphosphatase
VSAERTVASALDDVQVDDSPWQHALRLQQCAAEVGFSWADSGPVLDKLLEEIEELRVELKRGGNPARVEDELGDVLFVLVNLVRHAGVDADAALRHANAKFECRFRRMEQLASADGVDFARCTLAEQEALWQRVKRNERPDSGP